MTKKNPAPWRVQSELLMETARAARAAEVQHLIAIRFRFKPLAEYL